MAILALGVACGGCGDNNQLFVSIGGRVSGLAGSGLVLVNSSGEELAISADGRFEFAGHQKVGASYAVTVKSQPASPSQTCMVQHGTGIVGVDAVTDIDVTCVTGVFVVGGTVTGLQGTGLVVQNNGGDDLAISADGSFTFATAVSSGSAFSVTVQSQPTGPWQTCSVTGGSGTVGNGPVTTVVVNCSTDKFAIGGVISGLAGTVVLQNNGGDDITVSSNGSFAFPTTVSSGAIYGVTVLTQPSSPSQSCIVSSGTGTVAGMNVTSVRVDCSTNAFTVSGTVTGLAGSGLVLQNNNGDNLPISSDGTFVFATLIASGQPYAVTVLAQPSGPTQVCDVTNGSGTIGSADITNVVVTCATSTFTIGGTVTGLAGSGLVVQDNSGDDLPIAADGSFTFTTPVASGSAYAVTIKTQPSGPTQTCGVSGGSGTVGAGNVTSVAITCATDSFTIGGTVSGLAGTLVLKNNGGDDLTLTANGTFAFATPVVSAGTYAVTVGTQPGSPSQTCMIMNASGTVTSSSITDVTVTCVTNRFTIGGSVSGLAGSGLVLQNNSGDDLVITANGAFAFTTSIASGATYSVTVKTQPTQLSQTCVVTNGSGVVGGANVTGVSVQCTTDTFRVGGTVTGLVGTGLVLQDNAGDNLPVSSNGTFEFGTKVASGGTYSVTVLAQPLTPSQTCVVMNGSGPVTASDITTVTITCTTNTFTVGGTVTGLSGSGLVLRNNGGDDLAIASDGSFHFSTAVASGAMYDVTVAAQPVSPYQTCVVSGGSGIVGNGPVTSVAVNCTTNRYAVGGTISGLAGTVVLRNNGGDDLTLTANGSFAFATPIASGATYAVTVASQPGSPSQTCNVTGGTGTVAGVDVTTVSVSCTTNTFTIGGTISGLAAGDSIVLRDNGADDLTVSANGSFTFTTKVASGAMYNVTLVANPTAPVSQACIVTSASGVVAASNITSVVVSCTTNSYTVGGTVSGLVGTGLVLRDNGGDNLSISGNGSFTFATAVASGSPYAVSVFTQPSGQVCAVGNGSGTIAASNVSNVTISCASSKRVFVSSVMYDGNLGGLSGADAKCQGLADAAGLGGTYKAWLSDSTATAASRLTHSTAPYVLVDGTVIAANWTALTSGTLAAAITKTELNGTPPTGNTSCAGGGYKTVWSDTNANGTLSIASYSCTNWTSTSGGAVWGLSTQTNGSWSSWCSGGLCSWVSPIYCIEQ